MDNRFENWLRESPITMFYILSTVSLSLAIHFQLITVFKLYFNPILTFKHFQIWRLFTNFIYSGPFNIEFFLHLFFTVKFIIGLEKGSYNRRADFIWMILFGMVVLLILSLFFKIYFLNTPLIHMIVYVWSRRNPDLPIYFYSLVTFKASYLPFVLLLVSFLISVQTFFHELLGIIVGHLYFFLYDICLDVYHTTPLKAPKLMKILCGDEIEKPSENEDTESIASADNTSTENITASKNTLNNPSGNRFGKRENILKSPENIATLSENILSSSENISNSSENSSENITVSQEKSSTSLDDEQQKYSTFSEL